MNHRLSGLALVLRLALGGLVGAIAASPIVVGVVSIRSDAFPYAVGTSILLAVLTFLLPWAGRYQDLLGKLVLVLVAIAFTVTSIDLLSRLFLAGLVYNSPEDQYLTQWPKMPLVHRFVPNRTYSETVFGHLALGYPEYRINREIVFESDAHGFRNYQSDPADIDLIALGDSFGTGSGTTQQETWARVLANDYGFTVYNLSVAGSPWEEYTNLAIEVNRLDLTEDSVLLWMLFSGNDLEGEYYSIYEPDELPWNNWREAQVVAYQSFRFHSPIRLSLRRIYLASSIDDPVILEYLPDGKPFMFYRPYANRRDRTVEEIRQMGTFTALEETVVAMRQLSEANGFQVVIILAPSKPEVYAWMLDDGEPWSTSPSPTGLSIALQEVAEREGLCFLDLKPAMVNVSGELYQGSGELLWWPDDTHWNPIGNRFAADTIAKSLCLDGAREDMCCQTALTR